MIKTNKKRQRNLISKMVYQDVVQFSGRTTVATVVNVYFMGIRIYQKMFINPEWMKATEMRTNY